MKLPPPRFDHLLELHDGIGVIEHATGATPSRGHGYCTDDVARALVVVLRARSTRPELARLRRSCLAFIEQSQLPDGRFRNRRSAGAGGSWRDQGGGDDSIGRALWALGTTAAKAASQDERRRAQTAFRAGAWFRSPFPRAAAAAALGAVELLSVDPDDAGARALTAHAVDILTASAPRQRSWPWPEPRLAYENARLPEALIACGAAHRDKHLLKAGLGQLDWLIRTETRAAHFSFVPAGGWAAGGPRPAFDQQPIEAGAMADAAGRAYAVTGEKRYAQATIRAAEWFIGRNDAGLAVYDPITHGSGDGLHRDGVNTNQGAESTIAVITALQQAQRVQAAQRAASSASSRTSAAPTARSAAP